MQDAVEKAEKLRGNFLLARAKTTDKNLFPVLFTPKHRGDVVVGSIIKKGKHYHAYDKKHSSLGEFDQIMDAFLAVIYKSKLKDQGHIVLKPELIEDVIAVI